MTFKEKLEKFKSERVGFPIESEDIAFELAKVFTKEKLTGVGKEKFTVGAFMVAYGLADYYGAPYVDFNHLCEDEGVSVGSMDYDTKIKEKDIPIEFLDVTLEELKAYNG